jgi:hypothetical protein
MCGTDSTPTGSKLLLMKINDLGDTAAPTSWVGRFSSADGLGTTAKGVSVCATRDGGFAACGVGFRRGGMPSITTHAVYVVKTSSAGKLEWEKEYLTPLRGNSVGYCIQQTPEDDGYIISGEMISTGGSGGAGGTDSYLIKTNPAGDTLWTRVFVNKAPRDAAVSVQPTADGYIIGGFVSSGLNNATSGLLSKVDRRGDTVWTVTLGNVGGNSAISSVKASGDGNFIAAGFAVNMIGGEDALLLKFSTDGKELWRKMYGSTLNDRAMSVTPVTADNGFVFTGFTTTANAGGGTSADIYTVRTNAEGVMIQK